MAKFEFRLFRYLKPSSLFLFSLNPFENSKKIIFTLTLHTFGYSPGDENP